VTQEDFTIRMTDLRAAKMCSRGARRFFEQHGLDWQDFLKNGIPASALAATGDHMALTLVEMARGKQ
jgi:hypothetical protein